jgi:AbrB family looped-hinge helix DNA binding protein
MNSSSDTVNRIIVGTRGRIILPKEIREKLNIREGTVLEVKTEQNKVILEVVLP